MQTAKVIWLVGTKCPPGKEKEFNEWYDKIHVPNVLKTPGIVGATRYERIEEDDKFPTFLAIYEFEDEAALERLARNMANEPMVKDGQENMPKFGAEAPFLVHYRRIGP